MDFYLTEIKANNQEGLRIHFPINPQRVWVTMGAVTQDYSVINLGDIRFPQGNRVTEISWEGILPGRARAKASFVKDWRDPGMLYADLKRFKDAGAVLRLLITETPINIDVFIDSLDMTWAGGLGDIEYSISLSEYKPLKVYSTAERPITTTLAPAATTRPSKPAPRTYTVQKGDSLWKIAQRFLGKGSRYMEIVKANPGKIKNPNLIYPGQVLIIPS